MSTVLPIYLPDGCIAVHGATKGRIGRLIAVFWDQDLAGIFMRECFSRGYATCAFGIRPPV
jgi:hypothetical protein